MLQSNCAVLNLWLLFGILFAALGSNAQSSKAAGTAC